MFFFLLCYYVRYVTMTIIYFITQLSSDSVLGAIFGTLQFFYNHSEVSYFIITFHTMLL